MIQRVIEAGGPVRTVDRVVVIASPHDDVAGVISLIDPDGTAGESEIVALEHGATVAAMELARLRSLGLPTLAAGLATALAVGVVSAALVHLFARPMLASP